MGWIKKIGIYLFDTIEFYIGSVCINKLTSDYINIHGQLYYQNQSLYDTLINNELPKLISDNVYLYLPVPFWFAQLYGLAFPLVSLQYSEIQVIIKTRSLFDSIEWYYENDVSIDLLNKTLNENKDTIFLSDLEITGLIEYIYLDKAEREKFAKSNHEYLITQVQELVFKNIDSNNNMFDLDFFHCCKSLYWFCKQENSNSFTIPNSNKYSTNNPIYVSYIEQLADKTKPFDITVFHNGLNYLNNNLDANNNLQQDLALVKTYHNNEIIPIIKSNLVISGKNFANYGTSFFSNLHPFVYYKHAPETGINTYSFSLSPTDLQPSGTCNFSRLPKVSLKIELAPNLPSGINIDLKVYCINYNILRIVGGLAGLAYTYN